MHVQSNANDIVPPALSFPTWDIGQDRTAQSHGHVLLIWLSHLSRGVLPPWERTRQSSGCIHMYHYMKINSHGYLGYVYMTNLIGIWILFNFFYIVKKQHLHRSNCSLKNVHIIRIIKIITCRTIMWLWAHEDIDHRTEQLEAFAHADTVTEMPPKNKQTQKAKPKQEVRDAWESAADGLCIHLFTWAFSYIFPAPFSKSPLKPSF